MNRMLETINERCKNGMTSCLEEAEKKEVCSGSAFESLPDVTFNLGGKEVKLSADTYMGEALVNPMEKVQSETHLSSTSSPFILPQLLTSKASFAAEARAIQRCTPMFMGLDTMTDLGQLAILGMPFLRQYAVNFNRNSGNLGVAEIAPRSNACSGCSVPAGTVLQASTYDNEFGRGGQPVQEQRSTDVDDLHLVLQPSAEPTVDPAAGKEYVSMSRQGHPVKLSDLRLPWWAVNPKLRPTSRLILDAVNDDDLHRVTSSEDSNGDSTDTDEEWTFIM